MKRLVVCLLVVAAPFAFAQNSNSGQAANGTFSFASGNSSNTVSFDARIQNNGSTRGTITLTGSALDEQDVDGTGNPVSSGGFSLSASVDCLRFDPNNNTRAVMGATVTASSNPGYVGARTLLVVADGGEGPNKSADGFTWGVYRGGSLTWVASDGELTFDPGVGLTWTVSDAELTVDPNAHPSNSVSNTIDCNSFGFHLYDLNLLGPGSGNIQVKP